MQSGVSRDPQAVVTDGRNRSLTGRIRLVGPEEVGAARAARAVGRLRYDVPKRVIDVVVSAAVLAVSAPLCALIALLVRVTSPGPVIFGQERVGKDGQLFTMLKFRTMYIDADHSAQQEFNRRELAGELEECESFTLDCDARVTRVGAVLRKTSLDELPQLWNVLRGEMSLVGPRPSFDWEVALFEPRFRRRETVLPGVTGLWQVAGRRTIDMRGMLELDLEYVDSRSLAGDVAILVKTVPAVLRSTGAA